MVADGKTTLRRKESNPMAQTKDPDRNAQRAELAAQIEEVLAAAENGDLAAQTIAAEIRRAIARKQARRKPKAD